MNQPVLKYDFVIIGSEFGGSVSALRLSEKGLYHHGYYGKSDE